MWGLSEREYQRKLTAGTSLGAQLLRICLPMQGTPIRALPWSGRPHRPRSNKVHAPQLLSLRSRAHEPQLVKPVRLEPVLLNKRSHRNEKPAPRNEE